MRVSRFGWMEIEKVLFTNVVMVLYVHVRTKCVKALHDSQNMVTSRFDSKVTV